MQTVQPSTLTLPHMIGLPVDSTSCLLSADQIMQLGGLLMHTRPQDAQAVCFLGGPLGMLNDPSGPGAQCQVHLSDGQGEDPFLVIVSRHGLLALLSAPDYLPGGQLGYRVRISTDPDTVDRAALVLAQLSDYPYNLDTVCDPELQRAYVAEVIAALLTHDSPISSEIETLLPDETHWIVLARTLLGHHDDTTILTLPGIRQALQEWGCTRTLLGQLDAYSQELLVITADETAPSQIGVAGWGLGGVVRTLLLNPQVANPAAVWLGGTAVCAAPLPRDGRVWGVLLVSSPRPFSGASRANLGALGILLSHMLKGESRVTAIAPGPPALPALLPAQLNTSASLPAAPANSLPSNAATSAYSKPGERVAQIQRPAFAAKRSALSALLAIVSDGTIIVDSQGRLVAFNAVAAQQIGLDDTDVGSLLTESAASFLTPLLTEALIGEQDAAQLIDLPLGGQSVAQVQSLDQDGWAFLIKPGLDTRELATVEHSHTSPIPTISDTDRIERFLTTFSNGIRAPLRSLRDLIAQVSAAGGLSEQQSRLIGQVIKQNSEIMMLVNDLFALGQMRLQSPENRMPLRIDLLIDAAIGTQYAEYERRGQTVNTNIPSGLPLVPGSEEGLWRAISALFDNAIKYSPNGATITVDVRHEEREVVVVITDTGFGLSPDELEQVFDPFFRARSAEALDVPGRGLGLAIAKAVIEQHGGQIWATSTPGTGSTFAFSLPCG